MSRKVFFSFHYQRDAWYAGQVRNCNLLVDEDEYGFIDSVEWEKVERQGDAAIERWINDQLKDTSVTVVLIGTETAERDWVDYEIRKSWQRGNGLVGVRVHQMKHSDRVADTPGPNPLDQVRFPDGTPLSSICKTYDWVDDDGRNNLGRWIEEAFQSRKAYHGEEKLMTGDPVPSSSRVTPATAAARPTIIRNPSPPWAS
jgi:hypothetical protein